MRVASRQASRIIVTTLAVLCPAAHAHVSCKDSEMLMECWTRAEQSELPPLVDSVPDRTQQTAGAANNLLADVQQRLLAMPVGVAIGAARAATQNVLPGFSLAALPTGDGETPSAIQGVWNFAFAGASAHNSQLGVVTNPKPELAEPVKEALSQSGSARDDLESELSALDDVTGSFTWFYRGRLFGHNFGRDLALYRDELSSLLAQLLAEYPDSTDWGDRFSDRCIGGTSTDDIMGKKVKDVRNEAKFKKHEIDCEAQLAELPDAAIASAKLTEVLATRQKEVGLDRFADLVSNQPQLHVTLTRLERDPLVGASLTGVEVGFEMGWINLDNFMSDYGKTCHTGGLLGWGRSSEDSRARDTCVRGFERYVGEKRPQLDSQGRLAVRIGYAQLEDIDAQLPAGGGNVHVEGVDRLVAGLTLGYTFWQEQDSRSTRVDGSARHERYGNNTVRVNRTAYSLVLTQRVGVLSFPIVLAYSDKTEFRGEAGDLAATVGVGFDFGLPAPPVRPDVSLEPPLNVRGGV